MTFAKYKRAVTNALGRGITLREERFVKESHNIYMEPEKCAEIIRTTPDPTKDI